jgi:Fe-S-cluster containining protein
MEITLDIDFIRGIVAHEYERARDEVRREGVVRAFERSQQRHDERIASSPDVGTLACRAGCTWCCHFSVDVRAVEVFRILDLIEQTFTGEQKARLFAEIRANSEKLRGLDDLERMRFNVRCPFLAEGRCSIYAARPQTCRNYHATNVEGCKLSYEQPDNLEIDPEFAPYVYQAGGAHVDAVMAAMRDAGYDVGVYELNAAFQAAISDPSARQRFESKLGPFVDLPGNEVPPEFGDLDEE